MWQELWKHHKGKCIGVVGGIFLGVIYLISGFWDMLMFLLLIMIGYYFGGRADGGRPMLDFSAIYRWLTERWNIFR